MVRRGDTGIQLVVAYGVSSEVREHLAQQGR